MLHYNMNNPYHINLTFVFFAFVFLCFRTSLSLSHNDTHTLTQFRLQADAHGYLMANWTGADACAAVWHGVRCSSGNGRVVALSLPSLNLRGPIDTLSSLIHLRLLDLHDNRLNGSVLPLSNCTRLRLVYLSGNDFSDEIPPEIASLNHLLRLDLSDNNIRGFIPKEFSQLTRLLTLRLQNNVLSGPIPDLSVSLVNLNELNLTNNELYGRLPDAMLKKFGDISFSGNEGLCGSAPLPVCSFTENPPSSASPTETVPSNPSSLPESQTSVIARPNTPRRKGLSPGVIVAIVVGSCVALLVITSFIVAHCCNRGRRRRNPNSIAGSESGKRKSGSSGYGSEKKVYANNGSGDSDGSSGTERSKLVFFERRNQFELEELLRASAEMLGKGSLGTVYKAVLDDGSTVAVKRLKDANPCARSEFEQYMDVIGKVKHPNIVRFRAYYYAKEEKLLVYDYLPNGSLHSLLHGISLLCLSFHFSLLKLIFLKKNTLNI